MSKVTSNGGSSSYYELPLSDSVMAKISDAVAKGDRPIIETGDVIRMLVDNDFDAGNIIKALRRIFQAKKGTGKEGVDVEYDINKIRYFVDEIERNL